MHKVLSFFSKREKNKNKEREKKKKTCATKNEGKDFPPSFYNNKIITDVSKSYLGNNDLNFWFVDVEENVLGTLEHRALNAIRNTI